MSKTLLYPPETVTSFTLNTGCGKPHEYDGKHGIDCSACAEVVRSQSPEERISHPALRGPVPVQGATPEERATFQKIFEAERERSSWRLEEAADAPKAEPPKGVVLTGGPAYRLGRATAEAGLPPTNPYDHRTRDGKQWKAGYDSVDEGVETEE